MSRSAILVGILILLLALGVGGVVRLYQLQCQARLSGRLRSVCRMESAAFVVNEQTQINSIRGMLAGIGSSITRSGLLSAKTLLGLEHTLASAGFRRPDALGVFVGTKLLLLFVMPVLALLALLYLGQSPLIRNVGVAGAALVGLLGPDWWVSRQNNKHLSAIVEGLPDALDLMVICAQAGLSFEPSITRVATEIRHAHPAISQEFGQTASEMRVAADSRAALMNMGTRTGLECVKRMTSTLVQTMQYGTPLSDALRVLSAEMRQDMMIRFETRAARLPVLLTIPMILFILPCIFLIVGGPAVIQVMKSFHH
jgi:tight adherence protein C